jgi:hypothetical protein
MKIKDEETALSVLFANTKRKKRKVDLITLAESCSYLFKLYGSQSKVAKKIGLSNEMVRELQLPLKLPKLIQDLISKRKIDSIDVIKEIAVFKDPLQQISMVKNIANLPTKDIRDIKRLAIHNKLPIQESKKIILDSKLKGLHILIIDVDDETYKEIIRRAKNKKVKPAELVKEIVTNWIKKSK